MDDLISQTVSASFAHADVYFKDVSAHEAAGVLAKACEVALVLDQEGFILDAAVSSEALLKGGAKSWAGRKWSEIVTIESEAKIEKILEESHHEGPIKAREINHSLPNSDDTPIHYNTVRLGDTGRLIAFGRDLSRLSHLQQRLMNAQLAMEREFSRLRSEELRYRTLFQLVDVPQLLLEASSLKVVDINPAAQRVLGINDRKALGSRVTQLFGSEESDVLHQLLRATLEENGARDVTVTMRGGRHIAIHAVPFHQERNAHILLRMEADSANVVPLTYAAERQTLDLVEHMPDAFVVTSENRRVMSCNPAFANLLGLSSVVAA
ncbi:MAG: PAS domain-containing protein, partial [Pseudomonadota bacterium]